MAKLEVGTEIFQKHYSVISPIGKIIRVTDTTAFTENSKFKREYDETRQIVSKIPKESWSAYYFVPNENDKLELKKQNIISFVLNFKYSSLSFDKMCEIRDIIKRPE